MAAQVPKPAPEFTFTTDPLVSSFTVPYEKYIANQATRSGIPDYEYVAVGALVFCHFPTPTDTVGTVDTIVDTHTAAADHHSNGTQSLRVLLVQRAAHDSAPLRWEAPGGACDPEDASILHAVARELWEEAGLVARRIGPLVAPGHVFVTRGGKRVCKFEFLVDVVGDRVNDVEDDDGRRKDRGKDGDGKGGGIAPRIPQVKLDPNEHVDYVWATEEECREGRTIAGNIELAFTTRQQKATLLEAFKVWRELDGMN
ncbi:hypothetical protein AYO21_08958 [Fonsecaea monophora]|uniref:Nudix hydrolase domain-containing protein n=1 Tax=Fonsecaea monophora TaxID=254056 RepID=A0A177EXX6_9EURO|nr:hypothetical protein AYO21_08958 [Fonsecaea monophora]KAH0837442.1 hypothetical protein FOPE_05182 [Fonsecaea pedrosoi]OAG36885.1 hypothetical protein AYO21_08958 [Fonsecaea monophora]